MTGAGKSNGLKVLLRSLLAWLRNSNQDDQSTVVNLRVIVVDTHGEYAPIAGDIDPMARAINVVIPDAIDLLDEVSIKDGLKLARIDAGLKERIWAVTERLEDEGRAVEPSAVIDELRQVGATRGSTLDRIFRAFDREPDRFAVSPQPEFRNAVTGAAETFDEPGLYILNLSKVHDETERAESVGYLMQHVFERAKESDGRFDSLFVVDEAQNFAPESGLDPGAVIPGRDAYRGARGSQVRRRTDHLFAATSEHKHWTSIAVQHASHLPACQCE